MDEICKLSFWKATMKAELHKNKMKGGNVLSSRLSQRSDTQTLPQREENCQMLTTHAEVR